MPDPFKLKVHHVIHKFIPESRADTTQSIDITVPLYREYSLANAIVKSRILANIDGKGLVFPIHREARYAVKGGVQSLFDDLALSSGLQAQRFDEGKLYLDAPGRELDEALLRPGRCYAALNMRNLTAAEAVGLVAKLCGDDEQRKERALREALPEGTRSCSVASVYRACA